MSHFDRGRAVDRGITQRMPHLAKCTIVGVISGTDVPRARTQYARQMFGRMS
jgi:hypothetical protein